MNDNKRYPVPTGSISRRDGFLPSVSRTGRAIRACADALADRYGRRLGLSGEEYFNSPSGMAVVFAAMNSVFGKYFSVSDEELKDPLYAKERSTSLRDQFIFDVQTHFMSPDFTARYYLLLRRKARKWNPELHGEKLRLDKIRFDNYCREMFQISDTKMAVITSAPNDDPAKWFLHNEEMARARDSLNAQKGRKYVFSHALVTPRHLAWMEEFQYAVTDLKPDAWKCYTTGSPFTHSKYPWRLDDENLIYPAYETMVKSGIRNVCVHKGLLPPFYRLLMRGNWRYANIDDLPKAARDWPQLNFIIYHSAIQKGYEPSRADLREAEESGYIPWVSDLAAMPARYGLKNLYAEIGTTFAVSAVSNPRYCSAVLGTLIKGMGADHVLWGTDSVFYGSPQWQIEAFRRIEVPLDLQKKFGYSALGLPNGPIKRMIFGENAAKLYNVTPARGLKEKAA